MNHSYPPLQTALADANADLQRATERLDAALMAGGDTRDARIALNAAEEALKPLQVRQREADQAATAAAHDAVRQAEAEAAEQAQDAFEEAVAVIEPVDGVDLPAPVVPAMVLNAIQEVTRRKAALAETLKPHTAAQADRAIVAGRIASKQAALAAIAERRAAGDEQQDDAAQVHLLEQDLAAFRVKLAPLDARVAAAAEVVVEHRALVAGAEAVLQAAQAKAALDGQVERVRVLEAHFVAQVRALRLEAQKKGYRNFGTVFLPSTELRTLSYGGWI